MNAGTLISLVTAVAFVPLVVVLLLNRPWGRQQKLFALCVLATILWMWGDFLFRSSFFTPGHGLSVCLGSGADPLFPCLFLR